MTRQQSVSTTNCCQRIVILASGNGSNAQVLLDAVAGAADSAYEVVAIVSNHADAHVLTRAQTAGVRTEVLERQPGEPRDRYDQRLARVVSVHRPDLVVLAGWMRILTAAFCGQFRIINLHPAKPGAFPGANAIEDAFSAFQNDPSADETGVMVHWVPDAGVDTGPVILTQTVPILTDDTLDALTERVHAVEHRLLPQAVEAALAILSSERTTPLEVPS